MQERNKMSKEGFAKCVQMDLQKAMGVSYKVSLQEVTKNNGYKLLGIIIQGDSNVAPTIYLDNHYVHYCESDLPDEEYLEFVVMSILSQYGAEQQSGHLQLSMEFFKHWEMVKDRILCKVVNYAANTEMLLKCPHIRVLDLAIIFYYDFEDETLGSGTIQIFNNHLDMWNVTTEDLLTVTKVNMLKRIPDKIRSVKEVLAYMGCLQDCECPMYVLTNDYKTYGAVQMFDTKLLKQFSDEQGFTDLWILPSSVHEVLLLPVTEENMLVYLLSVVKAVNTNELRQEEFLSNNVYKFLYNREEVIIGGTDYE